MKIPTIVSCSAELSMKKVITLGPELLLIIRRGIFVAASSTFIVSFYFQRCVIFAKIHVSKLLPGIVKNIISSVDPRLMVLSCNMSTGKLKPEVTGYIDIYTFELLCSEIKKKTPFPGYLPSQHTTKTCIGPLWPVLSGRKQYDNCPIQEGSITVRYWFK